MAPMPLSPLLILFGVLGRSSFLIDQAMLHAVAPDLLKTLKHWVEWDGKGPLASCATYDTPLGALLVAAGVQVCAYPDAH